jgi:zinc protease
MLPSISKNGGVGEIKQYQLANGLAVLIKEIQQLPMASLGMFAKGGRALETPATAGLTGLALRTSLKGTANRSAAAMALAMENLGSAIHFSNHSDYCYYFLSILSKNLAAGFDILAEIIAAANFPDLELAKEKDNTAALIRREKDDMFQRPLNLFYSALFENHPYGLPANGETERIMNFNREEVQAWHRRLFQPENMLLAVVGDLEAEQLFELVEQKLGGLEPSPRVNKNKLTEPRPEKVVEKMETRNKQQSALALGFPGPSYGDEDYYSLIVLQNIISGLGGRFFEELRGRQSLAYSVSAFLVARLQAGAFVSYIATSPEKEEIAKSGLLREFEKLTKEPITAEELERAVRYTIGSYQIGLETYHAQMTENAHNLILGKGLEEIANFPRRIAQVTCEDILRAAQKYFTTDRYAIGLVRGKSVP